MILVGGSTAREGNVLVYGEPVCDDNWDTADGRVVCRQLGYRGLGRVTKESRYGRVSDRFGMDEVRCSGSEAGLADCRHLTAEDCGGGEGAGVVCLG